MKSLASTRWSENKQNITADTATRAKQRWTTDEQRLLLEMESKGTSITDMATTMKRTYYSINVELSRLLNNTAPRPVASAELGRPLCMMCFIHKTASGKCNCD